LEGPKVNSGASAEEDQNLSMGANALFVENPNDTSNRPRDLGVSCAALGPHLYELFMKAFVTGLHAPDQRPSASDWERALVKTLDLLFPCINPSCSRKWFVMSDRTNVVCPFCQTKPKGTIAVLKLRKESRSGQWLLDNQVVMYEDFHVANWHVFDNVFPGEEADRTPQAHCRFYNGQWILLNQNLSSMVSPGGKKVPLGQAVVLKDGAQIRLSQEPHGRIAEVQIIQIK
jgi:hypothetical protein